MKKISIFLFILPLFITCVNAEEFISQPGDVLLCKEDGITKARIVSQLLANKMKKEIGDILANGENDIDVIQAAIDRVYKYYGCGGTFIFRDGVYDLGKEGIKLYHNWRYFLKGESRERTILKYSGDGDAIGYKNVEFGAPVHILQIKNLSIHICGNAETAIWVRFPNYVCLEDISIFADKDTRPEIGIFIDAGGGNMKFLQNISISGPFEIGIKPATDHIMLFNIEVNGFRKYGLDIGGMCRILCVKLSTSCPEALAGMMVRGGIGDYRYQLIFKTFAHLRKYNSEGSPAAIFDVLDDTPRLKNYATFLSDSACTYVCNSSSSVKKEINGGRVIFVDKKCLKMLSSHKIKDRLKPSEEFIDIIIFKAGKDKDSAQVVSKRSADKLGVEVGHFLEAGNIIQEAINVLPTRGRLYIKSGVYRLKESLEISGDKDITIEGEGYWTGWPDYFPLYKEGIITGTLLDFFDEADIFVKSNKKYGGFRLNNLYIRSNAEVESMLHLLKTKAIIENCGFQSHKEINSCIFLENGCENILKNITVHVHASKVCIDDASERTTMLNPQTCGSIYGIKLGDKSVVFGGHIGIGSEKRDEPLSGVMVASLRGREVTSLLVGDFDESGGHLFPNYCHATADKSKLYLIAPMLGRGIKPIHEINGGEVIILK